MKLSTLVTIGLGLGLAFVDYQPGSGLAGITLVKQAQAIVGRPLTPVSVAGVARRTARRTVYRTSVFVPVLPPSCTVVVVEGASLHMCGSTYYQASGSQWVVVNVR